MASLKPKLLYIGNDSAATVYTVANTVGNYTIVKNINICNANTTSTKTATIHILTPTSNTAQANNIFISNFLVPANEVAQIDATIVLEQNYGIYISHSGNMTTTISGVEYS